MTERMRAQAIECAQCSSEEKEQETLYPSARLEHFSLHINGLWRAQLSPLCRGSSLRGIVAGALDTAPFAVCEGFGIENYDYGCKADRKA
jgi:hypothetical protein